MIAQFIHFESSKREKNKIKFKTVWKKCLQRIKIHGIVLAWYCVSSIDTPSLALICVPPFYSLLLQPFFSNPEFDSSHCVLIVSSIAINIQNSRLAVNIPAKPCRVWELSTPPLKKCNLGGWKDGSARGPEFNSAKPSLQPLVCGSYLLRNYMHLSTQRLASMVFTFYSRMSFQEWKMI